MSAAIGAGQLLKAWLGAGSIANGACSVRARYLHDGVRLTFPGDFYVTELFLRDATFYVNFPELIRPC